MVFGLSRASSSMVARQRLGSVSIWPPRTAAAARQRGRQVSVPEAR